MDFIDIFLKELAIKLYKFSDIKKQSINIEKDKSLLYKPIYNLKLIKLKNFKTYIKTNLGNSLIWLCKFLARTHILFHRKSTNTFYFYIYY